MHTKCKCKLCGMEWLSLLMTFSRTPNCPMCGSNRIRGIGLIDTKVKPENYDDLLGYEWYELSPLAPPCPMTKLVGFESYWAYRVTETKVWTPIKGGYVCRNDDARVILFRGDISNEDPVIWDAVLAWPLTLDKPITVVVENGNL